MHCGDSLEPRVWSRGHGNKGGIFDQRAGDRWVPRRDDEFSGDGGAIFASDDGLRAVEQSLVKAVGNFIWREVGAVPFAVAAHLDGGSVWLGVEWVAK